MIELHNIQLDNVVLFKQAELEVTEGLTTIRGHNRDSHISDDQNNGAGKSLLWSSVPNLLFNAPPLAKKKKAKKDMLGRKSQIAIAFKSIEGHDVVATQKASSYVVEEDGRDLEIRTVPLAERYLGQAFPLTQREFYSTAYIQSQRECPFQKGTEADRMHFISELFRLDAYDRLKEFFAAKLKDIKDRETEYAALSGKRTSTEAKLKKNTWTEDSVEELEELAEKSQHLLDEQERFQSRKHEAQVLLRGAEQLAKLETDLDSFRAQYKFRKHPHEMLPVLKKMLKAVEAYDQYVSDRKDYVSRTADLNHKLGELPKVEGTLDELKVSGRQLVMELEELEELYDDLEQKSEERQELTEQSQKVFKQLASLGFKGGKVPSQDVSDQIAALRTTIGLKKLLAEHDHDDAKCPTCLGEIDVSQIKRSVRNAEKALPRLLDLQEAQGLSDEYRRIKRKLGKLPKVDVEKAETDGFIKDTEHKIDLIKADVKTLEQRARLEQSLALIKKPTPVPKPKTRNTQQKISDSIELCQEIMQHIKAREAIWESYPDVRKLFERDDPVEHQRSIHDRAARAYARAKKQGAAVQQRLRTLELAQNSHGLLTQELSEFDTQLKKLRKTISRKKVYEGLVSAYGPKGIKTLAVRKIAEVLEANLNVYRNLIFSEPFSFKIEVEKNGMSVLVDRKNGHVSDIRLLSGSESDCFRLLFMVALLPLIPSDRRVNFAVLDEPDSHMDEASRDRFVTHFIPALLNIVPSVNLITPLNTEFDQARELVVVKEHGISTIQEVA